MSSLYIIGLIIAAINVVNNLVATFNFFCFPLSVTTKLVVVAITLGHIIVFLALYTIGG